MNYKFDPIFYCKAYEIKNIDALIHYNKFNKIGVGSKPRLRSEEHFYTLYPDFDYVSYSEINRDLKDLSCYQRLMEHYHHHGSTEGRSYSKKTETDDKKPKMKISSNKMMYINSIVNTINKINYKDNKLFIISKNLYEIIPIKKELIYLVIGKWGYPAFGGGEYWLIDTMKWMKSIGYKTYYIYFDKINKEREYFIVNNEINIENDMTYIHMDINDKITLYQFIRQLNPDIISHQGFYREEVLKISELLRIPLISGVCFWMDVIKYKTKECNHITDILNNDKIISDEKFDDYTQRMGIYLCSNFVKDVVDKYHYDNLLINSIPVIYTISDEKHYKIKEYDHTKAEYITIVNVSKARNINFIEEIIQKINHKFCIIDSQNNKKNKIKSILEKKRNNSMYMNTCSDMIKIYNKTKLLLVISHVDETFCKVAYEGLMNKIPILSTTFGNLKYILPPECLIENDDVSRWIERINSLVFDNNKLKNLYNNKINISNITQSVVKNNFYKFVNNNINTYHMKYLINNNKNIGIFCPWCDQGLGIQAREYYNLLSAIGYNVSIFSFAPFVDLKGIKKLQTDSNEWNYSNVYYSNNLREDITDEEFINYLFVYKPKYFVIIEINKHKVFHLAKICKLFDIKIYCIPNIEIINYKELYHFKIFDNILANNYSTFNILSNILPNVNHLGFKMSYNPNKILKIKKQTPQKLTFFCCGGLNSFIRKNINIVIESFQNIKNKNNILLYVFIQDTNTTLNTLKNLNINTSGIKIINPNNSHELFDDLNNQKQSNDQFNIILCIKSLTYKEIKELYYNFDIFIHMGDHEGLGLGFYESIDLGCPILTINTPPNNEIIKENINGWLIDCDYESLHDNSYGLINKALITSDILCNKLEYIIKEYTDINKYNTLLVSLNDDYNKNYKLNSYYDKLKKIFN